MFRYLSVKTVVYLSAEHGHFHNIHNDDSIDTVIVHPFREKPYQALRNATI